MKRIISMVLCVVMMVSALTAFAAEGMIQPHAACTHRNGTTTSSYTQQIGTCRYEDVTVTTCNSCGEELTRKTSSYYDHQGEIYAANGKFYCDACGKVV